MIKHSILYVSRVCSDKYFKNIYDQSKIKPRQQAQKFHSLIVKGLISNEHDVSAVSSLPLNSLNTDKLFVKKKTELYQNINYTYLGYTKSQFLKNIFNFISGFYEIFKWALKNKKKKPVIICDVLNLSLSTSALICSKILNINSIAIITDIPAFMSQYSIVRRTIFKRYLSKMYVFFSNYFISKYGYYVVLTEDMNTLVNPKNKNHVVIEGLVDKEISNLQNDLEKKYPEKIVLYAGALNEKYGIKKLINAFMKVDDINARLWLFGHEEIEGEIKYYEKLDDRIEYFGVKPNEEIVEIQLHSTLLVNPRPSSEEFTKYSFPSKNMEYMASGTPLLTTPLPGMPEEYKNYVYLFDDESETGFENTLKILLNKSKEELFEKGRIAKEFVLEKKNNTYQASKIIEMLSGNSN